MTYSLAICSSAGRGNVPRSLLQVASISTGWVVNGFFTAIAGIANAFMGSVSSVKTPILEVVSRDLDVPRHKRMRLIPPVECVVTHVDLEMEATRKVAEAVKPYFLSAYSKGDPDDRADREIDGKIYYVERFNHGLAHGLRQGMLAKDIFNLLVRLKNEGVVFNLPQADGLLTWAKRKFINDPDWVEKIEMASAFQRTGRQSEGTSEDPHYLQYELQDSVNFRQAALQSNLYSSEEERRIFEEAILWSNPGILNAETNEDLKYIRCILHSAHSFDLRRMHDFDGKRIQRDGLEQLFGCKCTSDSSGYFAKIRKALWDRSGLYLEATGDRDLVGQHPLQDCFFLQTKDPNTMVEALHCIGSLPVSI